MTDSTERHAYVVGAWKIPYAERDVAHEVVTDDDDRAFLDVIGADDDPNVPDGARVTYRVELTDAEAERFRVASNVRYVERDVVDSADGSGEFKLPQAEVLDYTNMDAVDLATWHGRDVTVAVLDAGTNTAVRDYMGYTLVGKATFGPDAAGSDEITGDHGCGTAPCAVPEDGRLMDLIVMNNSNVVQRADAVAAMRWAADNGAQIINISASGAPPDSVYEDGIIYLYDRNIPIFCSAGNNGLNRLNVPAAYSTSYANVHSCLAFDHRTDDLMAGSNYSADASGVAPGKDVISLRTNATTQTVSGTSYATPFMAQMCARLATGGTYTPMQASAALKANTRDTGQPTIEQGAGAYDMAAALAALEPEAPEAKAGTGRRNEVPNPSAANDVAGWLGAGTRTRVTGQTGAAPRPTAAEVTIPTSAWAVSLGCPGVPAAVGQTWSGVGWIWSTVNYTFQVGFVGWTGETYRSDVAQPVQVPVVANTWTEVRLPPATLVQGANTWELLNFQLNMPTAGSGTGVARLTGCRLEQVNDPAIAYADGDTEGWQWDGVAGSSTSTYVGTTEPEPEPEPTGGEVGVDGRVFVRDGVRWFWLADTAWAIFRRTEAQIMQYLDAREAQGFNTIHGVMMNPQAGGPTNAYGIAPYTGGTISNRNDAYWNHVDFFVEECAVRGMIAALHPMWADGQAGSVVTSSNAYGYGQFLGNRYRDSPNVTWTFGGDYPPTGQETMWAELADGIRSTGDTHVITYHPQGDQTSVQFFNTTSWIDFQAMQGGHCINYAVDRNLVAQTHNNTRGQPWIDAEPIYEQHPYCWVPSDGYATALDCRRDAYWRVLGGAAGHTYGHHSVWQFYTGSGGTSNPIDTWTTALNAEAANDMQWVKKLFLSRPRLEPANGRVSNPGTDAGWTPAAADVNGTTLVAYSAQGATRTIDKSGVAGSTARPWWYNPRTGEATQLADTAASGTQSFTPPSNNTDWVLVLDSVDAGYAAPGTTVHDVPPEPEPEPEPPGTVLGTTATLTWTPRVPGTYTVRYTATNVAGSGSDEFTVTVIPAVVDLPVPRGVRVRTRASAPRIEQVTALAGVARVRAPSRITDAGTLTHESTLTIGSARGTARAARPFLAHLQSIDVAAVRAGSTVGDVRVAQFAEPVVYGARSATIVARPRVVGGLLVRRVYVGVRAPVVDVAQIVDPPVHGMRSETSISPVGVLEQSSALNVPAARATVRVSRPRIEQSNDLVVYGGVWLQTRVARPSMVQAVPIAVFGARVTARVVDVPVVRAFPIPTLQTRITTRATSPRLTQSTDIATFGVVVPARNSRPVNLSNETIIGVLAVRTRAYANRAFLAHRIDPEIRDARAPARIGQPRLAQRTVLLVRGSVLVEPRIRQLSLAQGAFVDAFDVRSSVSVSRVPYMKTYMGRPGEPGDAPTTVTVEEAAGYVELVGFGGRARTLRRAGRVIVDPAESGER